VNAVAHAFQAVVFRGYVPGLVSALTLELPYAVWAFRGVRRARLRSGRRLAVLVGIAAIAHTPLAAAAVWAGKALV
ncbi:MAG: HXXEE domain-containing protein, partial [Gemmatimonadetes bacterium]|nr:HXXEE domain-containing protein [Gemmatimonadota bacterium]NIQ59406.1 HXXEE domain-containing protein [Gemmatimonadota bacterium]NIU79595.1 HXXEE domain-containing protein [Gammaproteobacteria bacterium]NIX48182.1 HXXEE domain-containing protein [Gemmatimonadota bacterium]NIY12593.1 HXXEE domain-containing protein [Gemmatimonadota bacterium]